jgi:hypothetical protein
MRERRKPSLNKALATKQILFGFFWLFLFSVSSLAQQKYESDVSYQKYETAQESLPEELQVPLFLKILTYDRSLGGKVQDTIHIGVLYFPDNEQSQKNKDAIIENLKLNKDKTINGVPFSFMEIKFSTEKSLDEVTSEKRLNILYITSDGSNIPKEVSQITQAKRILTITGRVDYVSHGISVGLGVKEEKPQIVINLPCVRAEGSDFSANLLRLCKVVN